MIGHYITYKPLDNDITRHIEFEAYTKNIAHFKLCLCQSEIHLILFLCRNR